MKRAWHDLQKFFRAMQRERFPRQRGPTFAAIQGSLLFVVLAVAVVVGVYIIPYTPVIAWLYTPNAWSRDVLAWVVVIQVAFTVLMTWVYLVRHGWRGWLAAAPMILYYALLAAGIRNVQQALEGRYYTVNADLMRTVAYTFWLAWMAFEVRDGPEREINHHAEEMLDAAGATIRRQEEP